MKFLNLTLFVFISIVLFFSGCDKDDPVSPEETVNLPTVVTVDINDITYHTAIGGGEVIDDGGSEVTARGVVWCTSPWPTLDDNKTNDGNGLGSFTSNITDLQLGRTYNVRAYATNSAGTAYGDQVLFTATEYGTITDIDGTVYQTVKIGNQWWMAENLRTSRYRNGDEVPSGLDSVAWQNTEAGAYAVFPYVAVDGIDSDEEMLKAYGALYNWYAVDDPRGLCPTGWHVPSDEEWTTLTDHLGGDSVAGGKLKSKRTEPDSHPRWLESTNLGTTNESGFSALPGSHRFAHGGFHYYSKNYSHSPGGHACFWTSTKGDAEPGFAWTRFMLYPSNEVYPFIGTRKGSGRSVRCMMYED